MDATVTAIQGEVTSLQVQVNSVAALVTSLYNQIATGAIDPTDETALQQVSAALQAMGAQLGVVLTPPAAPASKPAA